MSGLAHILESEGISTVTIGLIPQHIHRMRPPRALIVPFDLGRPFGAPGQPQLQREVLESALATLNDAASAPFVATFETSLAFSETTKGEEQEGWSCPVSFPSAPEGTDSASKVRDEIRLLMPWYDRGLRDRGYTAVGASDLDVKDLPAWLVDFGQSDFGQPQDSQEDGELGLQFKLAVEDLKAFYLEAATSQPGNPSSAETFDWFWDSTSAADLLRHLRDTLSDHPDPYVQLYAMATLVPEMRPPN